MKPIFRTSMFGFSREDVFNFITKQNKQIDSKMFELNSELDRQKAELEREKANFVRDVTEVERLKQALNESKELLKSISELANEISADKQRIFDCAVAIREERETEREKFQDMKKRAGEAEILREKAEKFDRLSGVLSSIFKQEEASVLTTDTSVPEQVCSETLCDSNSATDLLGFVEVLSTRCDKLCSILSKENFDA